MSPSEHVWPSPESEEDFLKTLSGKGVVGRAEVSKLAKSNSSQALATARRIEHPWYRCQAITSVVEANPSHPSAQSLLDEALQAAYAQDEPNRVASVALWPLRLLVDVHPLAAAEHMHRLLDIIAREPHGLRRLDGLAAILRAVMSNSELRPRALALFLQTAGVCFGWRTERIVEAIAQALAGFDRVAAAELLASRSPSRYTRRSRALLVSLSRGDSPDE